MAGMYAPPQPLGFAAFAFQLPYVRPMFDPMYAAMLVPAQPCDYICSRLPSSLRQESELGCPVAIPEKAVSQQESLVGLISREPSAARLPWSVLL